MHATPWWIAGADGSLECSNSEPCIDRAADGVTYDATGPSIEDRSQVHKAGRDCDIGVSRPEEFHLRPLAEPDVNLSAHPAPIFRLRRDSQRPMYERTRLTLRQSLEHLGGPCFTARQPLVLAPQPPDRNRFMLRHTGLSADPWKRP